MNAGYFYLHASNNQSSNLGKIGVQIRGKRLHVYRLDATPERKQTGTKLLYALLHFYPQTTQVHLQSSTQAVDFYRKLGFIQRNVRFKNFDWYENAWNAQKKRFRWHKLNDHQVQVDLNGAQNNGNKNKKNMTSDV